MIRECIESIVSGHDLDTDEAATAMQEIMAGRATDAQIGGLVIALRMKGETIDELVGMARAMRRNALKVQASKPLVDTCGTGGDGLGTFNVSTAAAFVAAAAGLRVAKHGNRAVSSTTGSADILELCGIEINLGPAAVEQCLEQIGIGFMFAPIFHPAMRHASGPRKEIGIRTAFNILGPLTNPAEPDFQIVGVARENLGAKVAHVLQRLGCKRALVVHGEDGADEFTLTGPSHVWEITDNGINSYTVSPHDVNLDHRNLEELKGGTTEQNRKIMETVLKGEPGPISDMVAFNSAGALFISGIVTNLKDGVELSKKLMANGDPWHKLEDLVKVSNQLSTK
ncbi:anthranilate phosphoribosyltransferase [SAR202 cluster bacterium AD-802-E10_MRT_200m]|nr:anthranilate phosphoribosyltransferase [SAR202 cluster bacterium AD-802-E10_MRT_200m]